MMKDHHNATEKIPNVLESNLKMFQYISLICVSTNIHNNGDLLNKLNVDFDVLSQ